MSNQAVPQASPGKPLSSSPEFSIFELRYKKGGLMHTLNFKASNKEIAIKRAQEYCEKRGLRFIFVNEWLQDIDKLIEFEPDEGFKR